MRLTDYYSRIATTFSMDPVKAMEILGIEGSGDFEKDKSLLRGLIMKYHPDRTGKISEEMKAVNVLQETYIRNGKPLPDVTPGRNTVRSEETTLNTNSYEKLNYLFEQNYLKRLGFYDENGEHREGVLTQLLPEGVFVMETRNPNDSVGVQEHDVSVDDIDW